jgi:hypothetical protein
MEDTVKSVTEQVAAVIEVLHAIAEVVKAAGPQGIPSGHLYAMLLGHLSLRQYELCIDKLISSNVIKQTNFVLTFVED